MNMMDPDDHIQVRPDVRGPSREQAMRFGCGCLSIAAAVIILLSIITPYANYLWFAHDARHVQVFAIAYETRAALFTAAFIPSLLILYFSLSRSLSVSLVYLRIPETLSEVLLSNALAWFRKHAATVTKLVALAVAFFMALGFAGEWNTYLLATHAQSFGRTDPIFHLDLGFFVFSLPWYLALSNYALGLLFLTAAFTIGIYVGMQMLASLAKIELSRPFVRMHVSSLIGLTILAFGVQMWLRRYEVGMAPGPHFTGAGYAGMQQLGSQTITAALVVLLGVATVVNGWVGRAFRIPIVGGIACAAFYFAAVIAYPALVQRFYVEPHLATCESPFAQRAIDMTRFGYALDRITWKKEPVADEPTAQELAGSRSTIDNMRLWDPTVLQTTLDNVQTLRSFYTFADVDVDRYTINGKQTLTMVAARDLNIEALPDNSRKWQFERLYYTHGFGITVSPVNTADEQGLPTYLVKDLPPVTPPEIPIKQPRIYFSDFRDVRHEPTDEYALVHTQMAEFDFPVGEKDQTSHWEGDRGIPFSGLLTRLVFSVLFEDINPLIAGANLTPDTRLLMHRNVKERCGLIYPFLQFDDDPYIVALNGRLVWVLDGYTTTGQIPYSARLEGAERPLNYIRNSVKATVDAYTGETVAYAIEPNDPILKAYRQIYPGLIHDLSELPPGLDKHFRYPEDLFSIQAVQLTQYHVDDPQVLLNSSQAWDIPNERGLSDVSEPCRPYYVQMRLPDEIKDGFLLILPFTPRGKPNMTGWLAAHCDPGKYGNLVLYQYSEGSNPPPGPEQEEAAFNQDKVIADINRQLNNDQSMLLSGNLLVVPIGQSLMYVEPLFLRSRTEGIAPKPKLVKVILALPKRGPVVADTYEEALEKLFPNGEAVAAPATPEVAATGQGPSGSAPNGTAPLPLAPTSLRKGIGEAAKLLDDAEAAQRAGDWAKYGDLIKQLKAKIKELEGK